MNEKCLIMIYFIYTASPRFLGWLDTEKIPVYCEDCGNWDSDNRGLAIYHFKSILIFYSLELCKRLFYGPYMQEL